MAGLNESVIKLIVDSGQGVKAVQDMEKTVKNLDWQTLQLNDSYKKGRVGLQEYRQEAAKLAKQQDDLAAAIKSTQSVMSTGKMDHVVKSQKDLGRATLETSRAVEDFQYGIKGVLNNIPGLVQMLGGGPGLAGVISLVAVGITTALPHIQNFMKSLDEKQVSKFTSDVKELTARIEEIGKKPMKLAVDFADLKAAEERLDKIKDAQAKFDSSKTTTAQDDLGKAVVTAVKNTIGSTEFSRKISEQRQIEAQQGKGDWLATAPDFEEYDKSRRRAEELQTKLDKGDTKTLTITHAGPITKDIAPEMKALLEEEKVKLEALKAKMTDYQRKQDDLLLGAAETGDGNAIASVKGFIKKGGVGAFGADLVNEMNAIPDTPAQMKAKKAEIEDEKRQEDSRKEWDAYSKKLLADDQAAQKKKAKSQARNFGPEVGNALDEQALEFMRDGMDDDEVTEKYKEATIKLLEGRIKGTAEEVDKVIAEVVEDQMGELFREAGGKGGAGAALEARKHAKDAKEQAKKVEAARKAKEAEEKGLADRVAEEFHVPPRQAQHIAKQAIQHMDQEDMDESGAVGVVMEGIRQKGENRQLAGEKQGAKADEQALIAQAAKYTQWMTGCSNAVAMEVGKKAVEKHKHDPALGIEVAAAEAYNEMLSRIQKRQPNFQKGGKGGGGRKAKGMRSVGPGDAEAEDVGGGGGGGGNLEQPVAMNAMLTRASIQQDTQVLGLLDALQVQAQRNAIALSQLTQRQRTALNRGN